MKIYFLNNWNGHNSPEKWNYCIKHKMPITGLIIGIDETSISPLERIYRIILFGLGLGINVSNK